MTSYLLKIQLQELHLLIQRLQNHEYTNRSLMLGSNSIGQHVRHIIELLQCLIGGYDEGVVNYDNRKRDHRLETERAFAMTWIKNFIEEVKLADKPLTLIQENDMSDVINSSYFRELLYNTEHAIHHMALIRVALREMKLEIVNDQFGVAPSTIKYLEKSCAQ